MGIVMKQVLAVALVQRTASPGSQYPEGGRGGGDYAARRLPRLTTGRPGVTPPSTVHNRIV